MPSRRSSAWRRHALTDHVRSSIESGAFVPGRRIPSLRSLGATFGLSAPTVLAELQTLIAEGAVVSVPGTGIFVADRDPRTRPVFLLVHPSWVDPADPHRRAIRLGFEETVSELGGATLTIGQDDLARLASEAAARIAGVVVWSAVSDSHADLLAGLMVPQVRIGQYRCEDARDGYDTVGLDNHTGGRIAAEHLLRRGCTRIAHLALHPVASQRLDAFRFSADRLAGSRDTLRRAHRADDGLVFQPDGTADDYHAALRATGAAAERMIERRDQFDAVVASDDNVVLTFAEAWHRRGLPDAELPPIIGFEDVEAARRYVTSSVVPQWHELGEHAAQLVWARHRGTLTTPPVHRPASMRFVARITAEADWLVGTRRRLVTSLP